MKAFFISDSHIRLDLFSKKKDSGEIKVLSFLSSLYKKADILFLVGDIFDIWYDWSHVIIKEYFPIFYALKKLKDGGCRIIFIPGNHDFLLNGFLDEYLGLEIFQNCFEGKIDGKKILVAHGDDFTKNDFRYNLYKSLMKSSFVNYVFSILHPHLGLKIGQLMSRSSAKSKKPSAKIGKMVSGLETFAKKKIEKSSFDLVVLGHSHKAVFKTFGKGTYINIGDFMSNFTYLKLVDGKPKLCRW